MFYTDFDSSTRRTRVAVVPSSIKSFAR
jgi:hypothetical protein